MSEKDFINAVNELRRFIQKEIRESNNNIRLDGLYQQLLLEHVFKRPEPLAAMTGWSIAPEFAWWLYQHVIMERPQKLIELGSGISTIVIATALKMNGGGKFLSFEHEYTYFEKTRELLELCELDSYVELIYSPLEVNEIDNEKYRWYSLPYDMIDHIIGYKGLDLLLIDGPPAATNRHARYPSLIRLHKYCNASTTILLDDASRDEEKEILGRWQEFMDEAYEFNLINNIRHGPALFFPSNTYKGDSSNVERGEGTVTDDDLDELFKAEFFNGLSEKDLNNIKNIVIGFFYKHRERSILNLKLKFAENDFHLRYLQVQLEKKDKKLSEQASVYEERLSDLIKHHKAKEQRFEEQIGIIELQKSKVEVDVQRGLRSNTELKMKLKRFESDRDVLIDELKHLVRKQKLIYKSLAYQLGLALYRQSRSPKRWIKIPFALRRVLRRHSVNGAPDVVEFNSNDVLPDLQLKLTDFDISRARKNNINLSVSNSLTENLRFSESSKFKQSNAIADICKRALVKNQQALCKTILRTSSLQGRELLVYLASNGELNMSEFQRILEACRVPVYEEQACKIIKELNQPWAIQLAEIMASQKFEVDDELNAFTLLWSVLSLSNGSSLSDMDKEALASLSITLKKPDKLKLILPYINQKRLVGQFIQIDSNNPIFNGDETRWLENINDIFSTYELESISLSEQGESIFSRIDSIPNKEIETGVLVTVIITAWCPDDALLQALKSILQQSWRNLEVIVVDDASPSEYMPVFNKCKDLDKRVRVIHQPVNQGTYVARNEGLAVANGVYVTFQDSDDWSHPRRIELQLKELESNPNLISCYSYCLSVSEELIFSRPYRKSFSKNTSSMMFRRAPVIERIGFMDSVRKGADTEYGLRMDVAFGVDSSCELKKPLAFIRLASGSLSRDEFRHGWQHPARLAYKNIYSYWHNLILTGEESGYLENSIEKRRFSAPLRFLVNREEPYQRNYDVVFIGDWFSYGGPQKSMLEEIKALHEKGMKLAICAMDVYRFLRSETSPLCEPVLELLYEGIVEQVVFDDKIKVQMVVFRYPPILQWIPHVNIAWKIGRAWIVANQAPHELDGSDIRYHVGDCIRNAKQLFGLDPIWVPQGPQVRKSLMPLVPVGLMADFDDPGIINVTEWKKNRTAWSSDIPILGRYSRDNLMKFPARIEEMSLAYLAGENVQVRIMGGDKSIPEIFGSKHIPDNWELLSYGQVSVKEFLSSIDFFVYFDNDLIVEAFGRSILEAIASGVVVILPERFREVFSEAAIYCTAEQVKNVVNDYFKNRDMYDKQVNTAMRVLEEQFSYESFFKKINAQINTEF